MNPSLWGPLVAIGCFVLLHLGAFLFAFGSLKAEVKNLSSGIANLNHELGNMSNYSARISVLETSLSSAHRRIDRLEGSPTK